MPSYECMVCEKPVKKLFTFCSEECNKKWEEAKKLSNRKLKYYFNKFWGIHPDDVKQEEREYDDIPF